MYSFSLPPSALGLFEAGELITLKDMLLPSLRDDRQISWE